MNNVSLKEQVTHYLSLVYDFDMLQKQNYQSHEEFADDLLTAMQLSPAQQKNSPAPHQNHWDETRSVLITYADSLLEKHSKPLHTLRDFVHRYCQDNISDIHILPFYPYSSDDGFSVINYTSVNDAHGEWSDIHALAQLKNLMFDLVINHCSSRSQWFQEFINGEGQGQNMFYTAEPEDDYSAVTRPRTSPLLRSTATAVGEKHVWCTFSHDQVDFDFTHPVVVLEFAKIIAFYLANGARLFRLDAVAFLWKELGTSCINHPNTHTIIKIYRLLIEHACHEAIVITETNIPNHENLQYFGNANEAHAIYNFALPPMLLHTLISGDSSAITRWQMAMPPAQNGTTYFNFIASHDGIGLRPVENLLSQAQKDALILSCQSQDARINWRTLPDGSQSAYEINIALFSACGVTHAGSDAWQIERFICAHSIMLGLEGIPGIYIHSLLGTPNDLARAENSGQNRCINRHQWDFSQLTTELSNPSSSHHLVYTQIDKLLRIRSKQKAFHPNATQFTLQLGKDIFGFWRQSIDRQQSIFCISNITNKTQTVNIQDINLVNTQNWFDLLSDKTLDKKDINIQLMPYQTVWITNR